MEKRELHVSAVLWAVRSQQPYKMERWMRFREIPVQEVQPMPGQNFCIRCGS